MKTKSRWKILEGLKRKVDIFLGTKNKFNPYSSTKKYYSYLFELNMFFFPINISTFSF